jgi:hypothetical protein
MAIEKPTRSDKPADEGGKSKKDLLTSLRSPAAGGMTRKRRWLVFGTNVALAIILATALVAAVVWISGAALRGKARSDWTLSGRFSLSPQTRAIVKDLKADLTITMVYTDPDQYVYESRDDYQKAKDEYERMSDLLQEFGFAGGRVKVDHLDPLNTPQADAFLDNLKKRFGEQLKAKDALMKDFTKFRGDVDAFIAQEVDKVSAFGTAQPPPSEALTEGLQVAANELVRMSRQVQLKLLGQSLGANLKTPEEEATLADAKSLTASVAQRFKQFPGFFTRILDAVSKPGQPAVPAAIKTFMETATARYEPLAKAAEELQKKIEALPKQKFDEIKESIGTRKQCLVLESGDDVQVIPVDDVWVRNPRAREGEAEKKDVFFGERVVSSAILSMTEKQKPALLFVTVGMPATMMGGPYGEMAERLRKNGFLVQDWELMREPELPKPENASKIILVFVPPPQPDMRQPMPPPSPEQYRLAIDAVKGGAPCLLLGDPSTMFAPPPPYGELFDLFGVDGKLNAIAVHSVVVDAAGTEKAVPQIEITRYTSDPISRPLGALPSMFFRAAPLVLKKEPPAGVTDSPLVMLPASRDYWADTNPMEAMRGDAKRDPATDITGPTPLAVAATRKVEKGEQRAVMFGTSSVAQDRIAFYREPFDVSDRFPGNAELFTNSVFWVAGMDHLISISPEALQARRIGDLGSAELPLRVLIIAGLPSLVLLVGIIVYVARRR